MDWPVCCSSSRLARISVHSAHGRMLHSLDPDLLAAARMGRRRGTRRCRTKERMPSGGLATGAIHAADLRTSPPSNASRTEADTGALAGAEEGAEREGGFIELQLEPGSQQPRLQPPRDRAASSRAARLPSS